MVILSVNHHAIRGVLFQEIPLRIVLGAARASDVQHHQRQDDDRSENETQRHDV